MTEIQNIPKIQVAYNYDMFSILDGNRCVTDGRIEKIKRSIGKVGYIPAPIIVNEKMEIIDGQGRYMALKDLGFPICYIIVPGLTIEHCMAMNINQTNWTIMDYVESYAKQGNENYKRLLDLVNKYSSLGFIAVSAIATETVSGVRTDVVRDGKLTVKSQRIRTADKICSWLTENILPLKGKIKGRFDYLLSAIVFCIEHTDVNRTRLVTVLRDNAYDIMPIASVAFAIKEIERVYNRKLSANKIYFTTDYDKFLTENVFSYQERWGAKKGNIVNC